MRNVSDVTMSMHPTDTPQTGTARSASVGAVIGARPQLSIVLAWPQAAMYWAV